jgi:hypothetical protein
MSVRENIIKIHQTLHGYAEGHRLLESSVKLPSNAARAALVLSDMSGPSMLPGFESYITGYPLPDINMYALGRTWYASEMSRPGCVWTHTILIDNADIAQIPNLTKLLELFLRPIKGSSWSSYKLPIEVQIEDGERNFPEYASEFEILAHQVLKALYGGSNEPVYLQAANSEHYENLLMLIWSQQWPRLRRSFKFCTGSLSNRKADGNPFDLQVVPRSLLSQIQREAAFGVVIQPTHNAVLVNTQEDESLNTSPHWLTAATDDLTSKPRNSIRRFLWRFGADLADGRIVFASLIQAYICISDVKSGKSTLAELLKLVNSLFPAPNQALRLKLALFGSPDSSKAHLLPWISEGKILTELVSNEHHAAFKPSSLAIRERAKALLISDRQAALDTALRIIDGEITPHGEEFLTGMCESLSIDDALYLSQTKQGLLPLIIQHNPSLISEPALWRHSHNVQRELFDTVIRQENAGETFLQSVVPVLLDSGSDTLAEDVVNYMGPKAVVVAILEWFDSEPKADVRALGERWQRILSWNKDHVLDWLKLKSDSAPRVTTIALIARMLDPHAYQTINAGSLIWLPLAKNGTDELEYNSLVSVMCFLLALGFHNPKPSGADLVTQAFEIVHAAAENKRLNYSDWGVLQSQAPPTSFWRGWDWCERLRCALIEYFIRYKWPNEHFLRATARPEIFQRVLDCCDMTSQGRKLFRRLKQQVAKGHVHATEQQRYLLNIYR